MNKNKKKCNKKIKFKSENNKPKNFNIYSKAIIKKYKKQMKGSEQRNFKGEPNGNANANRSNNVCVWKRILVYLIFLIFFLENLLSSIYQARRALIEFEIPRGIVPVVIIAIVSARLICFLFKSMLIRIILFNLKAFLDASPDIINLIYDLLDLFKNHEK